MSRTDKDRPCDHEAGHCKMHYPSWWRTMQRRAARERAAQDLRNNREPLPKYAKDDEYYW